MSKKLLVVLAVMFVLVAQLSLADQWNKKTKVTFSGPVHVPGATLPAGTYVVKLLDSQQDRNIVVFQDAKEKKTFATVLAVPDYRVNASSKTVMYFSEQRPGVPVPIKSWFYPGDNYGNRFVYPRAKAVEMAKTYNQPVASTPAPEPTKAAPVEVSTPKAPEPQKYAVAVFEEFDVKDSAGTDGEVVKEEVVVIEKKLPKTASPVHVIAGLGGLLLGASALARALGKKLS